MYIVTENRNIQLCHCHLSKYHVYQLFFGTILTFGGFRIELLHSKITYLEPYRSPCNPPLLFNHHIMRAIMCLLKIQERGAARDEIGYATWFGNGMSFLFIGIHVASIHPVMCQWHMQSTHFLIKPPMGIEPMTIRLRSACSTN